MVLQLVIGYPNSLEEKPETPEVLVAFTGRFARFGGFGVSWRKGEQWSVDQGHTLEVQRVSPFFIGWFYEFHHIIWSTTLDIQHWNFHEWIPQNHQGFEHRNVVFFPPLSVEWSGPPTYNLVDLHPPPTQDEDASQGLLRLGNPKF